MGLEKKAAEFSFACFVCPLLLLSSQELTVSLGTDSFVIPVSTNKKKKTENENKQNSKSEATTCPRASQCCHVLTLMTRDVA